MNQESKKAVIYARYSSDKQNEQSIEGQISVIEAYAKREGYEIIDTYIDRAMTGRSDDRPSFQKMIEDSKKRVFQYVLVYKLDRFSRDRYDSAIYKRALKNNGAKVISATENIGDNPEGTMLEAIIEGYSEYYSKELAQKVRRGNHESRKKGLFTGGKVPYGYKIVDKKYVIVEEEATIVKEVFKMVGTGMKMKEVAESLNSRMISFKDDAKWSIHAISRMINNEKYIGIARFGDDTFDNIVPAIITPDVFKMVKKQALRRKHECHREEESKYILSGKLFCLKCGSSLIGKSGNKKAGREMYHYYVCNGRKECGCTLPGIKKETIEMQVAKMAFDYIHSKSVEELAKGMTNSYNSKEKNDELDILESRKSDINRQIDNMYKAIQNGFYGENMNERISKLEDDRRQVESMIKNVTMNKPMDLSYDECVSFLNAILEIRLIDEKSMAKIIDTFVKAVYVDDENIKVIFNPSGDATINSRKDSFEIIKEEIKSENYDSKPTFESPRPSPLSPPNVNRTLILNQIY